MLWVGQLLTLYVLWAVTRNHWMRYILFAPIMVLGLIVGIFEIWHAVVKHTQKTQRDTWKHISETKTMRDLSQYLHNV